MTTACSTTPTPLRTRTMGKSSKPRRARHQRTTSWRMQLLLHEQRKTRLNTKMNKNKVVYWTATGIVAAIMAWSAVNFSFNEQMRGAFAHLGLPDWFRVELTVAKFLGVVALIVPATPGRLKEFA